MARRLVDHGERGWIVGGAVRDLALGREPKDLDMASAARPDQIEAWFDRTHAVGKAFGTVVIVTPDVDIQLTTFRSDSGYSDGRRPDEVRFGRTLEEDAARRDFTCNAMYLDPLEDELSDPVGGLPDLEAGLLRAVGEPRKRFAEDGLRLLRLARMAGTHGLTVEEGTWEGARAERGRIGSVSPERILAELTVLFANERAVEGISRVLELGLLETALEDFRPEEGERDRIRETLSRLPAAPGPALGLAVLFGGGRLSVLGGLRPSRELSAQVRGTLEVAEALFDLPQPGAEGSRAKRVRLARHACFENGMSLARAVGRERGPGVLDELDELEALSRSLGPFEPMITSVDLAALGVPRGPRYGELLRAAEELQLDDRFPSREDALAWLRAEVDADQEGGATRRRT